MAVGTCKKKPDNCRRKAGKAGSCGRYRKPFMDYGGALYWLKLGFLRFGGPAGGGTL